MLFRSNAYILQYVNCFGAVYNPVNFVAKSIALREEKKGSLTGSVIAFGGFICLSLLLAGFSIFQLFQSRSDNATWTNRCEAMSPIQNEYESLLEIEVNRKMIDVVDLIPKTNNNRFHDLLKKIEAQCPNTFNIQSFSSDEDKVTVNAVSTDKLLSISALQIQLNKVDGIRNVKIDSITETNEAMTKRKQYSYTITFDYTALTDANEKASELTGNQTE